MLPFKFGHADKWSLQREPFRLHLAPQMDVPIALEWLIWFEIAFGWTTSGIILALISGSLKKDYKLSIWSSPVRCSPAPAGERASRAPRGRRMRKVA